MRLLNSWLWFEEASPESLSYLNIPGKFPPKDGVELQRSHFTTFSSSSYLSSLKLLRMLVIDLHRTSLSTQSLTGAISTALTESGIVFTRRDSMDDFKAESLFDMSSIFEGTGLMTNLH